jgi:hypothetical protein
MVGAILFPAGVAVVLLKGGSICGSPDRRIADRGRGDGAIHCDRVPDLAGLIPSVPWDNHCVSPRRHLLSPSMA